MHDFVSDMVCVLLMVSLLNPERHKQGSQTPPWLHLTPSPELEDGSPSLNSRLPILTLFHFCSFPRSNSQHQGLHRRWSRFQMTCLTLPLWYSSFGWRLLYIYPHKFWHREKHWQIWYKAVSLHFHIFFFFNVFWESDLQSDTHWTVAKYSLVSLRQCQAYVRELTRSKICVPVTFISSEPHVHSECVSPLRDEAL